MRPLAATAGRSGGGDGVEAAALPAQRRLGDAAAEMFGGALIGRRRTVLGPLVGIRLRHRAEERAEPVEILGAAANKEYLVTVAWQGLAPVSAPPASIACGLNLYNGAVTSTSSNCTADRCRRAVTTVVRIATLT